MTATIPARMATTHRCINAISVHCTKGSGKPKRKSCTYCGSLLSTSEGYFGVFEWTGTGRYRIADAISLHSSELRAESARTGERVVRFVWA
jgi:hypothetical protein